MFLSRMLASRHDAPSIYETLRQPTEDERLLDELDQENLGLEFDDLRRNSFRSDAIANAKQSQSTTGAAGPDAFEPPRADGPSLDINEPLDWQANSDRAPERNVQKEDEDDVPASFLVEESRGPAQASRLGPAGEGEDAGAKLRESEVPRVFDRLPFPVPGPQETRPPAIVLANPFEDPYQRAAWMWANVDNLDRFFRDVYSYYVGHGIWSILLSRGIRLMWVVFALRLRPQTI